MKRMYNVLWIKLDEIKNYNSEVSIGRMIEKTKKDGKLHYNLLKVYK